MFYVSLSCGEGKTTVGRRLRRGPADRTFTATEDNSAKFTFGKPLAGVTFTPCGLASSGGLLGDQVDRG
jgi:hypothetical protein